MGTIVTKDVVQGTTIDPADFNNNFLAVKSEVNGNLDNTNLRAGAAISASKIAPGTTGQVLTTSGGTAQWLDPAGGGGGSSMPVGSGTDYWGTTAPSGWLFADGSAVSRTTYSALFAVVGTTYGSGDGSNTFNLPDKRGRVSVGKGTHADVDALGDNDGSTLTDRRPKHKHTVNDPTHVHPIRASQGGGGWGVDAGGAGTLDTYGQGGNVATGVTVGLQTSSPTDAPAYITCNYIIYAGV